MKIVVFSHFFDMISGVFPRFSLETKLFEASQSGLPPGAVAGRVQCHPGPHPGS